MTCLQDFATCLRKMLMTFTAILENNRAHFQLGIAICNLDYYPFEKTRRVIIKSSLSVAACLPLEMCVIQLCRIIAIVRLCRKCAPADEVRPLEAKKRFHPSPHHCLLPHIVQRLRMIIYGFYTSIDISQEKIINGRVEWVMIFLKEKARIA